MPSISFFERLVARKEIASYPPAITTHQTQIPPVFAQKIHPNIDALLEHFSSLGISNIHTIGPEEARRHTLDGAMPIMELPLETTRRLNEQPSIKRAQTIVETQVSQLAGNGDDSRHNSPARSPSFLHFDQLSASPEKNEKTKPIASTWGSSSSSLNTTTLLSRKQSHNSHPHRKRTRTLSGFSSKSGGSSTPDTFGRPSPRPMPTHANMLELGITGRSDWYKDAALPPLPPLDHPAFAEKNRITSAGAHKAQDISEKKHHSRDETINTVLPQNIPYKLRVRKLSHLSLFSTGRREGLHVEKESRDYNRTRSTSFVQPSSRLNALTATPTRASQYLDPNYSIRRERKKHHARTGQQAQISTGIKSSSSNRRLSVEWNALQASKGIGADEDNWQAQVTREILMLSGITVPESGGNNLSRDSHVSQSSASPHSSSRTAQDRLWADSVSLRGSQGKVNTAIDENMFHKSVDYRRARARDPLPSAFTDVSLEQNNTSVADTTTTTTDNALVVEEGSAAPSPTSPTNPPFPTTIPPNTSSILKTPNKGKRKADDLEEGTPPEKGKETTRSTRTTSFAADPIIADRDRRESSHAPSSYRSKRARLSTPNTLGEIPSRPPSKAGSISSRHPTPSIGKTASTRSVTHHTSVQHPRSPTPSKGSLSHASLPISALISPHAPSVSQAGTFHMKDPRKPAKRPTRTSWSLRLAENGEPGSPIHAWLFFTAFIVFPLWWVASFWRIPRTRRVGDEEKVAIDDPQVEFDARSWRFRCRIMSVVSIFTYIPFIILVAIFA